MLTGIYSAASALRTSELQQDVISTNLAHMNVPGYRRTMTTNATFDEELQAQMADEPGYGHLLDTLANDFTLGPMQSTGRALDLAIASDGFFAVQGADETLFTRNGVLHIGSDGQLVGSHGMPMLGENGPISIPTDITEAQLTITPDGQIVAGDRNLGQLRLVQFEDNSLLRQVGTTLFSGTLANQRQADVTVRQGMREQSNVAPVDEMVEMILAMRYYEAAQRTLKTIDDAVQQQTTPEG